MTERRAIGSHTAGPPLISLIAATGLAIVLSGPGAASQEFASPQGRAENVQFVRTGLTIAILYDLVADDAAAAFAIALEVSTDGGQTYTVKPRPENVSGDIGAAVKAGRGKRIVWEVGRDVETLQFDRFRFRVIAVSGAAKPVVRTGALQIESDPPGAEFEIRGTTHRGKAGTTVSALPEGSYQVVFRLAGYLETMSAVDLRAGRTETVRATLKLLPVQPPAPGPAPPSQSVEPKKGSPMKWIIPVIGVAGAAGAAAAMKGGGGSSAPPPPPGPLAPEQPVPVTIECTNYSLTIGGFLVGADFSESGGSQVVRVTASPGGCTSVWTASSNMSFFSVSPQTGTGTADVTVSAQANPGGPRTGTATIAGRSLSVVQSSASCTFTFGNTGPGGDGFDQPFDNNPAFSLNSGSGVIFFTLTTSQPDCVYRVIKTGAPVFQNSAPFTSTFSGRQGFGTQANTTSSNRTVVITFEAANGTQARSFNICQFRGDQPNPPPGTRCR